MMLPESSNSYLTGCLSLTALYKVNHPADTMLDGRDPARYSQDIGIRLSHVILHVDLVRIFGIFVTICAICMLEPHNESQVAKTLHFRIKPMKVRNGLILLDEDVL